MLWVVAGITALGAVVYLQERDRKRRVAAFEAGVHAERARWHAERRKARKELEAITAEVVRLHGVAEQYRLEIAEAICEAAEFGWAAELNLEIRALPETPRGVDG